MKKKIEKTVSKTSSSLKKVKKNVFKKRRFPHLYLIFGLTVLNVFLLVLFIILFTLIQFVSVRDIPVGKARQTTFSYFLKRPDLLTSSKALAIYDVTSNIFLLSKNENLRFSPASTAKVMSLLVALEHYPSDTVFTADYPAVTREGSRMGLFLGEKIGFLDLLYGVMLPSGNDAIYLIAENYPGGVNGFVSKMNEKALELGLDNTHFVDPAGYEDENYTTAYDLARLCAYALTNPTFAEVVKTREKTIYNVERTIPHQLKNLNELLSIPGVTGIKTGFTNEAEGVLTTSFTYNKHSYVIVVLRSQDRFQDTLELIKGITQDLKDQNYAL
ncbi:MAG: D-alanyl-D-alanine carboxypeptidase family protein [Candidatus Levyibacteriota bacterium]